MSPQKLVDGKLVEIDEEEHQEAHASWELYRGPDSEPLGRKVTPDGTVLQEDVSVPEEAVVEAENKATREGLNRNTQISAALSSAPGQEIISLLVELGVLSVQDALDAGWTPPS